MAELLDGEDVMVEHWVQLDVQQHLGRQALLERWLPKNHIGQRNSWNGRRGWRRTRSTIPDMSRAGPSGETHFSDTDSFRTSAIWWGMAPTQNTPTKSRFCHSTLCMVVETWVLFNYEEQ